MFKLSIRNTAVALALCAASTLMAVPARKGLMTVTMPNGTELRVRLAGDEFFHQYFTEDGYPLTRHQGEFHYCDITASGDMIDSGIKATDISARTAEAEQFLRGVDLAGLDSRLRVRSAMARELKMTEGPAT